MNDDELIKKLSETWSNDSWDQVLQYKQLFKDKLNYYKYIIKNIGFRELVNIWDAIKFDWLDIQIILTDLYNHGVYGRNKPRVCPNCGLILQSRFISHINSCGVDQRNYVIAVTNDNGICHVCNSIKPIIHDYYFPEYCCDSCAKSDSRSRWSYEDHPWKSKDEIDKHNLKFNYRDYSGLDYGRKLVNKLRSSGDKRLLDIARHNLIRAHMANSYLHCEEFGISKGELYTRLINRDMSVQVNAMHEAQLRNGFYESKAQSYHASCIPYESRVKAGLASVESRFDGRLGKKSIYLGLEMASMGELLGTILFHLEHPTYKLIDNHKAIPNYINDLGSSYTDSIFKSLEGILYNVEIHDINDSDVVNKKKFCSEVNGYKFVLINSNISDLIEKIYNLGYNSGRIVDYVSKFNKLHKMPTINLDEWKIV